MLLYFYILLGDHEYNASTIDSSKHTKFHFNLETKNPFKYDSSDNENDNEEIEPKNEQHTNHLVKVTNRFFFDINDIRFNGTYCNKYR